MYDYTIKIDATRAEKKLLKGYLFTTFNINPTIKKDKDTLTITCHGYSLEEKAKNKNMIVNAISNFRLYVFNLK